jgi:tripartite-type tricarboxylate transporter receptor subunit TctC
MSRCAQWCALLALSVLGTAAAAQTYPAKPLRIVTPFPAGGGVDIVSRAYAQRLSTALAQPVIVDNRAGADGMIGTEIVARSPKDGYTLLFASTGPLVINPALTSKLAYDTVRDFAPITLAVENPMCLVVHPSIPARTVRELIAFAKARPGQLNYASGGIGNALHLAGEMFKSLAGVDIVHVPYKGGAPAVVDLVAGNVHMMISSIPMMLPQIRSGRLRALAVNAPERLPLLPEVPTMREAGLRGFGANSWYGILAPAGVAPAALDRLSTESMRILRSDDMRAYLIQQGAYAVGSTREEFAAHIRAELAKWAAAVKAAGLSGA